MADGLARAAMTDDRSGFDALTSTRDPSFADRTRLLATNLMALPLTSLDIRLDPAEQPVTPTRATVLGPSAWVQHATVTWQLAGDVGPAEHEVWLTFVVDGGVKLAGTIDAPRDTPRTQQPTWWLGPVQSAQDGTATAVVGAGQDPRVWAALGAGAASRVRAELPRPLVRRWDGTVVLEVPASERQFEAVLGARPGNGGSVAAVALREGSRAGAAIRVVVNPRIRDLVPADQLRRVLVHEIVHVATRATDSAAPTWAEEGLAEWVSLRDRPGQSSWGTDELLEQVRNDGPPKALPTDSAFNGSLAPRNRAYAEAWFFCRYVADTYTPEQLGEFMVALDDGRSVDAAARDVFGVRVDRLVAGWRSDLERRARGA